MADLKQVKRISQREKDIVYGYIKQIQSIFPYNINPYYIIVQLIQDLCLLYYRVLIDTQILTNEEKMTLLQMIPNKSFTKEWKLLYRRSRDGASRDDFYKKCDKMDKTICIIQTPQNNVFGGYTSLKWYKSTHEQVISVTDPTAFVYLIRSKSEHKEHVKIKKKEPKIWFVQEKGLNAIQHYYSGYLSFGAYGGAFYFDQYGSIDINYYRCQQYDLGARTLNGNDYSTQPTEVEVFQIIE